MAPHGRTAKLAGLGGRGCLVGGHAAVSQPVGRERRQCDMRQRSQSAAEKVAAVTARRDCRFSAVEQLLDTRGGTIRVEQLQGQVLPTRTRGRASTTYKGGTTRITRTSARVERAVTQWWNITRGETG